MESGIPGFWAMVLAAACVTNGTTAWAACEAKSGDATLPLLELYTSEGCDSCPPADRWLAELPRAGFGADRLVPLAFHVDYWNYLGWIDPFAQNIFSQRQREFGRRTRASTVYTPEFVLNGREYRRRSESGLADELQRIARTPPRADISIGLDRSGTTLRIKSEASLRDSAAPAELYIALYENNLRTDVRAGENRGRTLPHEFVVRRLIGPLAFDRSGKAKAHETLTLATDWKNADLGVAAFVQESSGTGILQALALPVCR